MTILKIENPARPIVELWAFAGWTAAAMALIAQVLVANVPVGPVVWAACGIILPMGLYRGWQVIRRYKKVLALVEVRFNKLPVSPELLKKMRQKATSLFVGYGFEWGPEHTQLAYQIRKTPLVKQTAEPPFLLAKIFRTGPEGMDVIGAPWIHGLGHEADQFIPLKALEGHTLIFGVPGSGKTRLLELLVTQAIHRPGRQVVIVVDPKGDKDLEKRMRIEAQRAGRADDYAFFHVAFAEQSFRIDPLHNFTRQTEIPSRVSALIKSEADNFTAFAWNTVNTIVGGLLYIGERPTLKQITLYAQNGVDGLLERALEKYFEEHINDWQRRITPYSQKAKTVKGPTPTTPPRLVAMVMFYKQEASRERANETVDALVSLFEHNREWLGKMVAVLIPVLRMLTTGELGDLLSPNANDPADPRPIFDTAKLINLRKIVYFGLDTLSDATVGRAIGAMLMADIASVLGSRYNFGVDDVVINLYVDEAEQVVNEPCIQNLNKGRGAGLQATLASQTYPDFIARLGNEAQAQMVLGNTNNLIALRSRDGATQEYITQQFGTIAIQTATVSHGTNTSSDANITDFSGSLQTKVTEKDVELFPKELLGMLPTFHYVAAVSGGRIIKGRLPILS